MVAQYSLNSKAGWILAGIHDYVSALCKSIWQSFIQNVSIWNFKTSYNLVLLLKSWRKITFSTFKSQLFSLVINVKFLNGIGLKLDKSNWIPSGLDRVLHMLNTGLSYCRRSTRDLHFEKKNLPTLHKIPKMLMKGKIQSFQVLIEGPFKTIRVRFLD
jgi:hypothetical protein